MSRLVFAGLAGALPLLTAVAALAAAKGDPVAGRQVFVQCTACHKIDASGVSGVGPNLNRVVGRRAGTLPGYRYSPAMTGANRVWDDRTLDAYLTAPAQAIPGNRMPFAGLRDPAARRNVIAYIRSASR
jgi:cytochrome c2